MSKQIDDNGVLVEESPMGRSPMEPVPVILGLSKSKRGFVGQSALIRPGQRVNILDWQTDDDQNSIPVTLILGVPNRADALSGGVNYAVLHAVVQYGIGGAQNEILMDVIPGNMITLPATFIRVDIVSDAASTESIQVSAFLSRFSVSHPPAKYTKISPGTLAVGSSVLRSTPSLARSVRVYINNDFPLDTTGAWALLFLNPGFTISAFPFAAGVVDSGELTLPGDCFFVGIINLGGTKTITQWRMVFSLY